MEAIDVDLSRSGESSPASSADGNVTESRPTGSEQHDADPPVGYQPAHDAAVYETSVDLADPDDAHGLVVAMTGEGKRVLELGCARGSTTKVLQEHGCTIVGIEIDATAAAAAEQFAERVVVADLDLLDVDEVLGDDSFDVIIAADVLEHLRDPGRVLVSCLRHLRPGGEVVLSIPNIAHADVRLSLLQGDFEYQWCGILDETHMRFFTRRTLEAFLAECDLVALDWDRTKRPIGGTEIAWHAPPEASLLDWVAAQPDSDTYQFVLRAAPAAAGSHLRELGERVHHLQAAATENIELRAELERMTDDNGRLVEAVAQLEVMVADLQSSLTAAQERSELERERNQLEAASAVLEVHDALADVAEARHELDAYRASFDALAGVQEELVAVRRSESFRIGTALLSPFVTMRRVARAWRRAKLPG